MAPPAARWLAGQCGCGTARAARVPPARSRVGGGVARDPALDTRPSADADWRRRGRRWLALAGMVSEPVRTSAVRGCPSASWCAISSTAERSSHTGVPPDTARPAGDRRADLRNDRSQQAAEQRTIPLFDKTLVVLLPTRPRVNVICSMVQ